MKVDDILNEWDGDCGIDKTDLVSSSIKSAKLHTKYLRYLITHKNIKTALSNEYANLRKIKFKYYRGELTRQELAEKGWEQYQYTKPLKNEMDEILKGDVDLSKIQMRMDYNDTIIYCLESILTQIKARDWQMKNIIDYTKFLAGQ